MALPPGIKGLNGISWPRWIIRSIVRFVCLECHKRYVDGAAIRNHMKTSHGVEHYKVEFLSEEVLLFTM